MFRFRSVFPNRRYKEDVRSIGKMFAGECSLFGIVDVSMHLKQKSEGAL